MTDTLEGVEALLDHEGLLERCLGQEALVKRVLTKYCEGFPRELAELQQVAANRDSEGLARVAHRMKGAAASVGAKPLREAFAIIEDMGQTSTLDGLDQQVEFVETQSETLLRFARNTFL